MGFGGVFRTASCWFARAAGVAAAGSLGVLVLWWGTAFFYVRTGPRHCVAVAVLRNDNVGPCPVRHHDRDVARGLGVDFC